MKYGGDDDEGNEIWWWWWRCWKFNYNVYPIEQNTNSRSEENTSLIRILHKEVYEIMFVQETPIETRTYQRTLAAKLLIGKNKIKKKHPDANHFCK